MTQYDYNKPELVMFGPMEGCGCPWERWILCSITLDLHFEADGTCDVYADGGDWDYSFNTTGRDSAFAWVRSLPTEEELAARQRQ